MSALFLERPSRPVPDTILSALDPLTHVILIAPCEEGTVSVPIVQVRKLRPCNLPKKRQNYGDSKRSCGGQRLAGREG